MSRSLFSWSDMGAPINGREHKWVAGGLRPLEVEL